MDNNFSYSHKCFLKSAWIRKIKIHTLRILLLILILAAWEVMARYEIIDDFIFCSPSILFECAKEMILSGMLIEHLLSTLYVTLLSFVLVTVLSISASLALWINRGLSYVLEPYLIVLNSLPKSALAPLFIVWLGNNKTTTIVAGISVAIFGSIMTLFTSFCEIDPEKERLIYTLGGSRMTVLTKVLIPGNLAVIIGNMKVNIGLCLIGIIIGEMISSKSGLGYLIIYGTQVFKLDYVLLSIIILCMIAILFYLAMNTAEKFVSHISHFSE